MVATNDVGDSVPSRETEAATTLQDGEKLGCWHCMGEKKWEDGALRGFENIIWCKGMGSVSDFSFSSPRSLCVFFPVPNEPPVILSVKPTTTTSVLVHWKVSSDFWHTNNPWYRAAQQNIWFGCTLFTYFEDKTPYSLCVNLYCMCFISWV